MKIFIKAINRKKVIKPGSKGGKYWIDRSGNIRYDVKGRPRPKAVDMASEMFMDNIRYFAGMARNIGTKFGIMLEFVDSQPVGDFADILAEGRLAAIKAYSDYFDHKYKNVDLLMVMKKRAAAAMYGAAERLKWQFNMSGNDRRHLSLINQYRDRYFDQNEHYPSIDEIAENVALKNVNTGEEYSHEKKIGIIEGVGLPMSGTVKDVEDLPSEPEAERTEFPRAEIINSIDMLHKKGKITDVGYKIIQMYLGAGKYKEMGLQEIGNKLKMSRQLINYHFQSNAKVLKPYMEKYRARLEKSISTDRIREFIREVLEIKNPPQSSKVRD